MKNKNKKSDHSMAHVLYQKLGRDWYAFADVNGDCYVAKVDEDYIQEKISNNPNAKTTIPEEVLKKFAA